VAPGERRGVSPTCVSNDLKTRRAYAAPLACLTPSPLAATHSPRRGARGGAHTTFRALHPVERFTGRSITRPGHPAEGTPEAQLDADLQAASAAATATTAPASADYEEAVHAAALQWVTDVSPAWTAFKNAAASAAQTFANAAASAAQTLATATSGNAMTYAQTVVPAAQQLADDQAANAEAWFASTAPATQQWMDAQADHAQAAYNDFVCGEQTFADAVVDDADVEATADIAASVAYVAAVAPGAAAFLAANQQPGDVPAVQPAAQGGEPPFVKLSDFLSNMSEFLTQPVCSLGLEGIGVDFNNPLAASPSAWQAGFLDAVGSYAPDADAFPSLPLFSPLTDPKDLFIGIAVKTLDNVMEPQFHFEGSPLNYAEAGLIAAGAIMAYESFGQKLVPEISLPFQSTVVSPNQIPVQIKQKITAKHSGGNPDIGQDPFWQFQGELALSPHFSEDSRLRWLNGFSLYLSFTSSEFEHIGDLHEMHLDRSERLSEKSSCCKLGD
jgi:hypothetical protein